MSRRPVNSQTPTVMKKDLRHRFYASVVFLSAVTGAYAKNRRRVPQDLTTRHDHGSSEATFMDFVNTLSQFCDVKLGGDSVTAFTVLDFQDRVQYRFACNRLNKSRLTRIATFVTDLLATLRGSSTAGGDAPDLVLLEKALGHCRTRVHSYLGYFKDSCRACIETRPADSASVKQLREFIKVAGEADFKSKPDNEFTRLCKRLMTLIETCHKQPDTIFAEPATHGSMNESSSCWSELRHYAGRLVSYTHGVRTLLEAAAAFPRLLETFEVVSVRSSDPDDNPLQDFEVTADNILSRMVTATQTAAHYHALAQETRSLDLDATIQSIVSSGSAGGDDNHNHNHNSSSSSTTTTTKNKKNNSGGAFQPIVHAELLVLQSLEREGLVRPPSFFGAWRYIGSSKPTCRLCSEYFRAHEGGFSVRPTHGNLYVSWKSPDVLRRDGDAALRARVDVLTRMLGPLRAEALRTLEEKAPLGRPHDSSTGMTVRTGAVGGFDAGGSGGEEEEEEGWEVGTVNGDVDGEASYDDDDDDEEEGGAASK